MSQWRFYSKSGNPQSDLIESWLRNNAIPVDQKSIFMIDKEEVQELIIRNGGDIRSLVYPDEFSYKLIFPQKKKELPYLEKIRNGEINKEEAIDVLTLYPSMLMTPILMSEDEFIVGYDLESLDTLVREVKVK
ncbi:ArsC/Spx/MgsR family protein [Bacillus sp. FJAT-50079]|uniref:arsenate reductase family protein n=1 Tax=Bacillus sp. FJAT-50079 TaxID=2833577 RepID=UPI001BCA30F2|nr:ArsC/Spx/MgsR family protein [Bacillus sp. FJAT-50079]MBS4206622.1 hypothetical protein [Bacillus sp. FJAT-50079]